MIPIARYISPTKCESNLEKPCLLVGPKPPARLSDDLKELRRLSDGQSLTIDDLEKALKGRGFAMLLLLLALPFCFISVPGLSIPFGIAVFIIGIRIAAGLKPWLPAFIRQVPIPPTRLLKLLDGGLHFAQTLERVVKPRMHFLQRWPGMTNLIGLGIASGGLILLLPLPVPFSNAIPAWAVVFLTAGMMERDGLLVLLGHFATLASWVFIALCWVACSEGIERLFSTLQGGTP